MKIDRKELLAALEPLKPALGTHTVIKSLTNIWFDTHFVYAHDGGMGIKVALETPFNLGVPGTLLLGLLSWLGSDDLILGADDDALIVKSGRSSHKLVTQPIEDRIWPYPDKITGKPVVTIPLSKELLSGLSKVFVVRPVQPTRMEHHAVCVFPFEEDLDLYTTDSIQLAGISVATKIEGNVKNIAIPRPFAEQLVAQCKEDSTLTLYRDYFVVAATDKITLYSNVLDSSGMLDLPGAVDKYVEKKPMPVIPIPEAFYSALERAVLLSGSDKSIVTLETSGKTLHLSGDFSAGLIKEEFDLAKSAAKCSIDLMAKSLLAVKEVDSMMLTPDVINLRGPGGFIYLLCGYGVSAKPKEEKPAD